MPSRLLIILELLLAALAATAQSPAAFFNSGAQLYISNNVPAALQKTEAGLKLYPANVELQKLEKLLKQQQKQNQQSQSQQNKNQQNQSRQNQPKNPQPQNPSPQNSGNQSSPPKPQNGQPDQKQSSAQKQSQTQSQAALQDKMTPSQAKRLLDSQKDNEQFLQLKPKPPPPQNTPIKDW
ncbi:MAG: hypothetical protein KGR98_04750 [Verrucomicrobia bacterium]|nr:hypothetical protein [Verrucomicrobiota bacterium]MDE3098495.1 hypothetical protein [Verrucomicrobiota bacterium]